jgi:nitrite reductase/ring-hydroxylating ferredoxin subunit
MRHALAGTPLCRLEDIEDGAGRGFILGTGAEEVSIFVVREGAQAVAYVNACPHLGTPLDWGGFDGAGGRFVSADSGRILCATHGAEFRIDDGFCLAGPCAGARLWRAEIACRADGLLCFQGIAAAPDWA